MSTPEDTEKDAALGRKARELVQALVDGAALLAVDAPTLALVRQIAVIQELGREIAAECGVDWDSEIVDMAQENLHRMPEIVMAYATAQEKSSS